MDESATHPKRDARRIRRFARIAGFLALLLTFLTAAAALADIYHYVDSDGNHHFTSYRQRGMRLIEVVSGDTSSSSSPRNSTRSRRRSRSQNSTPRDPDAFDEIIREAAERYTLPFAFIKAVIRTESSFNPGAVSRSGAEGLMQLMPATAESLGVEDSFDPRQNIMGGTRYLRMLSDRFQGDINLVLAGYNAGPGAVQRAEGIPFEATAGYVRNVFGHYQTYLTAADTE